MGDEDQVSRALKLDKDSGKFEPDERGYLRFIPSEKEQKAIEQWLAAEIELAEGEYKSLYADAAENLAVYKAAKIDSIDGETPILPAPVTRIAVDQQSAWLYNTIMRPKPLASFEPYFKDEYPLIVPFSAQDPQTGAPVDVPMVVPKSSEDASYYLEQGYDYVLRELVNFPRIVKEAIDDASIVSVGYAKVCYETDVQTAYQPKVKGVFLDLNDKEEIDASASAVKWYGIPYFNILKRVHETDLDECEWMLERLAPSPSKFSAQCHSGEHFLIEEKDYKKLADMVTDPRPEEQKNAEQTTQGKIQQTPKNCIDVRLVWLYRWLKFKDANGQKRVRRVSLLGEFHRASNRLLNCYRNYRDDQLRPYASCHQMRDAHSDTGSSTTSISKWFQKVITFMTHAEIKSAMHANVPLYWFDPDSPADAALQGGKRKLHAGDGIGAIFEKEWGTARLGEEHYSLAPLINLFRSWLREAQNMSAMESGEDVPGRTPAQTVSQILTQGLQQLITFLRNINDFTVRLIRLDLATRRQFEPMGQVIPTRDPETQAYIEIPFRYPMGDISKNFRISLTAADEMLAKEHEFDQNLLALNTWQTYTQFVATVAGPLIMNPEATPAARALAVRIVEAGQTLFDKIISQTRTDKDKFDLAKSVNAMAEEANAVSQQMEAMNAQNQAPNAGGVQPGPGVEPPPGGPPQPPEQPPIPPGGGAAETASVQGGEGLIQ
jgi:hypothetical protein